MAKKKATKKTIAAKKKAGAWFTPVRGSYLPISWQGWLLYVPFVLLSVWPIKVFYIAWRDCKTETNVFCSNESWAIVTLRVIAAAAVYYAILGCAMTIIAKRRS